MSYKLLSVNLWVIGLLSRIPMYDFLETAATNLKTIVRVIHLDLLQICESTILNTKLLIRHCNATQKSSRIKQILWFFLRNFIEPDKEPKQLKSMCARIFISTYNQSINIVHIPHWIFPNNLNTTFSFFPSNKLHTYPSKSDLDRQFTAHTKTLWCSSIKKVLLWQISVTTDPHIFVIATCI